LQFSDPTVYTVQNVEVRGAWQSYIDGNHVHNLACSDSQKYIIFRHDMQVGRPEMVVGWYHSHPGFGCWLSGVDISTQNSFEQLNPRAVAVVVDPVQSVPGKVVIDAFRLINAQTVMLGQDPRQTTSVLGHLNRPSIQVCCVSSASCALLNDRHRLHSGWQSNVLQSAALIYSQDSLIRTSLI
jgi:proteasome lid subunit RPN8/RPN11